MSKDTTRAAVLDRRRAMTADERAQSAEAIAAHVLAQPVVAGAARIAAYVSMPSEPGTGPTIAALRDRGVEVIVPITLDGGQLDWVVYEPGMETVKASLGISEPLGDRLGPEALSSVDLILVPALGVDHWGNRLGRGAGYYDRALAGASAPLCALLFSGEIVPALPHDEHDVPVHMVVTPTGVFRVP